MEGKDKIDELLISYLLDELNAEEDALVFEWIQANEQNKLHFEEVKQTLNLIRIGQVVDKVNVDVEWNRFEQARQGKEPKTVLLNEAQKFGNEVIKEVGHKRKTNIYRTIALTAVAACIVLAIGLGWSLYNNGTPMQPTVTKTIVDRPVTGKPFIRNLVNSSNQTSEYQLLDGTTVLLFPKSELSFQEPFESDRRSLYLSGKAEFRVAKDMQKPFTVFSGDISTTALGTMFTVTAFKNSNNIFVRLFEGKVVVKLVRQNPKNEDYYLMPGHELVYNRQKEKGIIRYFKVPVLEPKSPRSSNSAHVDSPSIPNYGKISWFMFNNQPLYQVLDQLADMYNVEIKYSRKDISKMYFIGTFNKSDSLESVLKQVTKLNDLELIRENNKFTIRKK